MSPIKLTIMYCIILSRFHADVEIISGSLVFQSATGQQRRCACVNVKQDIIDEEEEVFTISASSLNPTVGFTSSTAAVVIVDDDGMPSYFI